MGNRKITSEIMKTLNKLFTAIILLLGFTTATAQKLNFGDQGDGTYKNPILPADYSDPDVIRVGSHYYMVASDFHFIGMQVLESEDLVNWRLISQIYDKFDLPGWEGNNHYGGGSWAPSIRFHDGKFWVYFCTIDDGLMMSNATDPHGPWTPLYCVKKIPKWEDPCPFWDDDGQAYLGHSVHRAGPIIIHKMSADGKELLDSGVTVYRGPVAEGTKIMKRNGWYYLIIPEGGVGQGWQTCLRSRSIYGPYERRIVLEQGSTNVNGPHQGGLVDSPDGKWWFIHFQETNPLGRIVHLEPAEWDDDWLKIGVDKDGNGIGEPVDVWQKPNNLSKPVLPATSDEFNTTLGLQWQWNHNPHNDYWSLTENKGFLTIKAEPADDLKSAHNMLTQKVMGYKSTATTTVDATNIGNAYAGLLCIGKEFRGIGICRGGIYVEENGQRRIVQAGQFKKVRFRLNIDTNANAFRLAYNTNNDESRWTYVGEAFPMKNGYWKGARTGVYCYGNDGKGLFDYFHYDIEK